MSVTNNNSSGNKKKQSKRQADVALIATLVTLSVVSLLYVGNTTSRLHRQDDEKDHSFDTPPLRPVQAERLEGEKIFWRSIKSCLPKYKDKCQEYVPGTKPRVAVLAPPGMFGSWSFGWISSRIQASLDKNVSVEDVMELQLTPHVPAYGYGKTHGWTRLIRVMPDNLMLGTADAVRGSLTGKANTVDLKIALRQLMRWHCRISHVAAHTAVLTLDMRTLARTPQQAAKSLLSFLRLNMTKHYQQYGSEGDNSEDQPAVLFKKNPQDAIDYAEATRLAVYASSLLTSLQHSSSPSSSSSSSLPIVDIRKELEIVLAEELSLSKNQTVWPCPSLWAVKPLRPTGKRLAQVLVPNCTAKYAKCGVPRDLCEQKGDTECKK